MTEKLECYASGDGALHLVFTDEHNKATGRKATFEDAERYLRSSGAANLRMEKWRVVIINTLTTLVGNIKRIDAETLDINDREFRYSIDPNSLFWNRDRHCQDHHLTVETEYKGKVVNVVNYSLRSQIRHFLNNEESLTPACTS